MNNRADDKNQLHLVQTPTPQILSYIFDIMPKPISFPRNIHVLVPSEEGTKQVAEIRQTENDYAFLDIGNCNWSNPGPVISNKEWIRIRDISRV
jgi:hypothetical protein